MKCSKFDLNITNLYELSIKRFTYGLNDDRMHLAEGLALALDLFEDLETKHWKNKYLKQ